MTGVCKQTSMMRDCACNVTRDRRGTSSVIYWTYYNSRFFTFSGYQKQKASKLFSCHVASRIKWKTDNTTLSEQLQNPTEKLEERDKINTPNTQIHARSPSLLGTGTQIKSGAVKPASLTKTSPLAKILRPSKWLFFSCTLFVYHDEYKLLFDERIMTTMMMMSALC